MSHYDPATFTPPPCPTCGTPIDIDWIEIRDLGKVDPEWIPGKLSCPKSRYHSTEGADMALIELTRGEESEWCQPAMLDDSRLCGWRPVDPEHQTPTEMVEARVEQLQREQRGLHGSGLAWRGCGSWPPGSAGSSHSP